MDVDVQYSGPLGPSGLYCFPPALSALTPAEVWRLDSPSTLTITSTAFLRTYTVVQLKRSSGKRTLIPMLDDSKHIINDKSFDKYYGNHFGYFTKAPHVKAYLLNLTLDVEIPAILT